MGRLGKRLVHTAALVGVSGAGLLVIATVTVSVALAAYVTVFGTNFNTGVPSTFSGVTTTEGVQGYTGLGTGSNIFSGDFLRNTTGDNYGGGLPPSKTTLSLTELPAHASISIGFLLAIMESWDGVGCFAGPDFFNVTVDGIPIFSETFENAFCGTQTYVPPAGVELARHVQLDVEHLDSAYNMGLDPIFQNIPHTASTLTLEWFASGVGWQGGIDESWAIDNVEVALDVVDTPRPTCNGAPATIYVGADGRIVGGPSNGQLYQGTLTGTPISEVIVGTDARDTLNGRGRNDLICGLDGDDILRGADGDDTLVGGFGRDVLVGDDGNDMLTGNADADRFKGGGGSDTATDFKPAEGDTTTGVEVVL